MKALSPLRMEIRRCTGSVSKSDHLMQEWGQRKGEGDATGSFRNDVFAGLIWSALLNTRLPLIQ